MRGPGESFQPAVGTLDADDCRWETVVGFLVMVLRIHTAITTLRK